MTLKMARVKKEIININKLSKRLIRQTETISELALQVRLSTDDICLTLEEIKRNEK